MVILTSSSQLLIELFDKNINKQQKTKDTEYHNQPP